MRILQLHTRYRQAGGEDRVVAAEADLLRSAGHTVEQLLADNPRSSMAAAGAMLKSPWNSASRQAVERAVARFKPDVAHVHNTWYALSPSVLDELRASRVPTVMTVHNYRLMCVNGMLLRDGGPCEDCVGRSPLPGIRHRCYRNSVVASTVAAATIGYNRRRKTWADGVANVAGIVAALPTGADWPPPVSDVVGEGDADAGLGDGLDFVATPGTYGVICSANTSPTGDILKVFLVGPLVVGP